MEIPDKVFKYLVVVLGVALIVLAVYAYIGSRKTDKLITELQNVIAQKDTTIEVQRQVYTKLAADHDDLRSLIDTSTAEGKRLAAEVKKNSQDLVALTTAVGNIKVTTGSGTGTSTTLPSGEVKVDFSKDFGWLRIDGWTRTSKPPSYELSYSQGSKPLKLTVAVSQQDDDSWRAYVASSEASVGFDIGVAAVNPKPLRMKWYERLAVQTELGAGKNGVIAGAGATFGFGRFDLGPMVWGTTNGGVYYGGTMSWSPFYGR